MWGCFFVFSAIMGKLGIIGGFPALVCFGFFLIKKRLWDLEFEPMLLVSGLTLDKICNFDCGFHLINFHFPHQVWCATP